VAVEEFPDHPEEVNLPISVEFKYIPNPSVLVLPPLIFPRLQEVAYQLKFNNFTGLPLTYEGCVIVIELLSVADAKVTVPPLEILVALAALPVILIFQVPEAPVPVFVGASVIPYPAKVVGLLDKLANGIAILAVPSNETPAIVLAV
jgi:hypothetical protein